MGEIGTTFSAIPRHNDRLKLRGIAVDVGLTAMDGTAGHTGIADVPIVYQSLAQDH
jgi:hypothetical protein